MKKTRYHTMVLLSCMFLLTACAAHAVASDSDFPPERQILKIRQASVLFQSANSGMTPEQRADTQLKEDRADTAGNGADGVIGKISEKITLSGAIELDYSYADDADTGDNTISDATSGLDIGTVELGLEADLHPYVKANALLKGENTDSDDDRVFWDEIFFTVAGDGTPFYFVGGKRCQPFGLYENFFINGPITQELYEINDTGITIGYVNESLHRIDISATVYKGATLINQVDEAVYGDDAGYEDTNDMKSLILSAAISPVDSLLLSAYYDSEPGDTDKNTTLGSSLHWEFYKFILDLEYITALNRERHVTDNREYHESAWFASLGYQVSDPFVAAVRYENLEADLSASGNLDYRYGFAAAYTLFEDDNFACSLMGEYRRSEYEFISGSGTDRDLNEFFTRVTLEF